jgi:hypothetical protein
VYNFITEELMKKEDIIKNIKEDIEEYKAENNYYKVLKREFSLAMLNNNVALSEFLIRIFKFIF